MSMDLVKGRPIKKSLKEKSIEAAKYLGFKDYNFNKYKVILSIDTNYYNNEILEELFNKRNSYLFLLKRDFWELDKYGMFSYVEKYKKYIDFYNYCFEHINKKPNLLIMFDRNYLIDINVSKKFFNVIDLTKINSGEFVKKLIYLSIFHKGNVLLDTTDFMDFISGYFTIDEKERKNLTNIYWKLLSEFLKVETPEVLSYKKYFFDVKPIEAILFASITQGIKENYGSINKKFENDLDIFKQNLLNQKKNTMFNYFYDNEQIINLYGIYYLAIKKYEWIFKEFYFHFHNEEKDKIKFEEKKILKETWENYEKRYSWVTKPYYFLGDLVIFNDVLGRFKVDEFEKIRQKFNRPINSIEGLDLYIKFTVDIYLNFLDYNKKILDDIINLYNMYVKNTKNHEIFYDIVETIKSALDDEYTKDFSVKITPIILNFYITYLDKDLNDLDKWKKFKEHVRFSSNRYEINNILWDVYKTIKSKKYDYNIDRKTIWEKELNAELYKRAHHLIIENIEEKKKDLSLSL